jgi:hypothetical protein
MVGKRFGRLVVLGASDKPRFLSCLCDCGTKRDIRMDHLTSGATISCGCFRREHSRESMLKVTEIKHRMTHTPEHRAWRNFNYRCRTSTSDKYSRYGGRGICVCKRYQEDFMNFYNDLGPRPSSMHSIDRIDNDGNYSCGICSECKDNYWPANLRWATRCQQSQNTCVVYGSVAEQARLVGLNPNTVRGRIFRGYSLEESLSIPLGYQRSQKK